MQGYFYELADFVATRLRGAEQYTCSFSGEDSDFVRFNHSAIRQAGTVAQRYLTLALISGRQHATLTFTLTGDRALDQARLGSGLRDLRELVRQVPEDPHLLYATDVRSGEQLGHDRLPEDRTAIAEAALEVSRGRDLVGMYAAGGVYHGFANSFGQRNWFSSYTYNLDWSFFQDGDKAVKLKDAGFSWNPDTFERKMQGAIHALDALTGPSRTIAPGRYRVYLAPSALAELAELLAWGSFGLKAQRTKQTPLLKMHELGERWDPRVSIVENVRDGVAPNFEPGGFLRPDRVSLIERGAVRDCLVSPRSAKEYGVPTNGASAGEMPFSLEMAAGRIPGDEILRRLGTGIYVSNLWYLNFSDRAACRITGLTRFATLWVEHGEIQAPLKVMRFDDSLYRMFGDKLLGLTTEREFLLDADTYHARSTRSYRLPGALMEDLAFTL